MLYGQHGQLLKMWTIHTMCNKQFSYAVHIKQTTTLRFIMIWRVLIFGPGDNWLQARTKKETPLHVLNPMSLHIDLFQCLVVDSQLPR